MSLREAEGPPLVKGREKTRENQQGGGEGSGTEAAGQQGAAAARPSGLTPPAGCDMAAGSG